MSTSDAPIEIVDDEGRQQLLLHMGNDTAELTYRIVKDKLMITHTGVPSHLAGNGIGSRLIVAAIKKAVTAGLTVVPSCPFAQWWIAKNPEEFAALTAGS